MSVAAWLIATFGDRVSDFWLDQGQRFITECMASISETVSSSFHSSSSTAVWDPDSGSGCASLTFPTRAWGRVIPGVKWWGSPTPGRLDADIGTETAMRNKLPAGPSYCLDLLTVSRLLETTYLQIIHLARHMTIPYRSSLALLTPESSANKAQTLLEGSRKALGFVPNMYAAMANAPGLLETYQLGYQRFREESGFSPVEQEVVFLTISFDNGCDYCMAAHSVIADAFSKVPKDITDAIRTGSDLPDPKLRALSGFTRHMLQTRGRPTTVEVNAFVAAGYSESQILYLILAVGVKIFSNYTNHVFSTPVDSAFASRIWTPPSR